MLSELRKFKPKNDEDRKELCEVLGLIEMAMEAREEALKIFSHDELHAIVSRAARLLNKDIPDNFDQ